jgi:hypothetical protein
MNLGTVLEMQSELSNELFAYIALTSVGLLIKGKDIRAIKWWRV